MNDLHSKDISFYYPALALELIFPRAGRRTIRRLMAGLVLGSAVAAAAFVVTLASRYGVAGPWLDSAAPLILSVLTRIVGVGALGFALWLVLVSLDALYYSLASRGDERGDRMSYEAAQVFFAARRFDLVYGLFNSASGRQLARRLGIAHSDATRFARGKLPPVFDYSKSRPPRILDFASAAMLALDDRRLLDFVVSGGITKELFAAAAAFTGRTARGTRIKERWWDIRNLKQIRGFGTEWSYGGAWFLRRYTTPLDVSSLYQQPNPDRGFGTKEAEALEAVLERSHETNALLISDDKLSAGIVLGRLWGMISGGSYTGPFGRKKMLVLNSARLMAQAGTQAELERILIRLFDDTQRAGNIILIFEELPEFSRNARNLGVDFDTLIDPYLGSNKLQIIATSAPEAFHREFGESGELAARFEQIFIKEPGIDAMITLLENKVVDVEGRAGIFFTYQALRAITDSARDYSGFGSLLDHALDLLDEAVVKGRRSGGKDITAADIGALVAAKTGVPSSEMSQRERSDLLHLEARLSKRVVGQHAAVKAVAGAVRRARSGLASHERPMSSFLFLGPTGVGKTETAKALAEVFFEGEDKIIRLDMSEYTGPDALDRLIGSSASGHPGALSQVLREQPYGVLLLDEFEKAARSAHDLFLQILDEGFFTDMRGKRVSARNLIVIATSNAAGDYIWQLVGQGTDPASAREQVTRRLIEQGLFRPELLNRFDGVIIFHPLSSKDLAAVAGIMLAELGDKLGRKGYKLEISDGLISFLVKAGYDPAFGARPMSRAITDSIEQLIARKIISGDLNPGDKIAFSREELKAME